MKSFRQDRINVSVTFKQASWTTGKQISISLEVWIGLTLPLVPQCFTTCMYYCHSKHFNIQAKTSHILFSNISKKMCPYAIWHFFPERLCGSQTIQLTSLIKCCQHREIILHLILVHTVSTGHEQSKVVHAHLSRSACGKTRSGQLSKNTSVHVSGVDSNLFQSSSVGQCASYFRATLFPEKSTYTLPWHHLLCFNLSNMFSVRYWKCSYLTNVTR